jgi:hypothetical protein
MSIVSEAQNILEWINNGNDVRKSMDSKKPDDTRLGLHHFGSNGQMVREILNRKS